MDKELTIITEPEELIAWADTFDILLKSCVIYETIHRKSWVR